MRNYDTLLNWLVNEYSMQHPLSAELNEKANNVMVDGGNHLVRLMKPFPPRIKSAKGADIIDEDGHVITDFWQGHFANILGHNPEIITSGLSKAFDAGYGLQTGFSEGLQIEAAEILCRLTRNECVRFTTSGTLATMYAIMLACSFTRRSLVLKISGGWHGGQPWGLKGVKYKKGSGYDHFESEGIPPNFDENVLLTQFNNSEALKDLFSKHGEKLACFILEPVVGGGGFIPATNEYLQTVRDLCDRYGVVLIFDEIISGFRFRAGDVGELYGVKADLSTFGKIIGGGMPVSAVAGKKNIMEMAGRSSGPRVMFSGGTYSGHPSSMLATKLILNHLEQNEQEIYHRIAALGQKVRQLCVEAFKSEGIYAVCSGMNSDLPDSSIFYLHFPYRENGIITSPEDVNDPEKCDLTLRSTIVPLGLLTQNVNLIEGQGAVSFSHSEQRIQIIAGACAWLARQIKIQS